MVVSLMIGIDPGSKQCVAVAVDQTGLMCGKAMRFTPDRPGVGQLVERLQRRFPTAERHFVVEASGTYWRPPATGLRELGESVSLVSPISTKAQRKVSSRYAKSDAKDAEALARSTFNMGERATHPADIPTGTRLSLQTLCRHRKLLQEDATSIKLRICSWLEMATPGLTAVLGTNLTPMDRAFIRRYPVVAKILRLGRKRLTTFLERHSRKPLEPKLVDELFALAENAYSPEDLDPELFAQQIDMELERLEQIERQIAHLEAQIEPLYAQCDPEGLARSIPGLGKVIAPIMVAEAGADLSRFATPARFAAWTGVVARAHGSSGKHTEGLPMTKAGRAIVKCALYQAANIARQKDPDLKALYERLTERGKHHNVALNAVAHKLARVYWAVMTHQMPYQTPDPNVTESP